MQTLHLFDGRNSQYMTIKLDRTEQDFIINAKSLGTKLPLDKEKLMDQRLSPVKSRFIDVRKKRVKIVWKFMVVAEKTGIRKSRRFLITERKHIFLVPGSLAARNHFDVTIDRERRRRTNQSRRL